MRLSELTGRNGSLAAIEISGITADSRLVAPGFLFVAMPGSVSDGRDFIPAALKAGAAAVMSEPIDGVDFAGAIHVPTRNPRLDYAQMAARFFGRQPETIVAVTGTNGKTSVAHFTAQIWAGLGKTAGSVGTLGVLSDAVRVPGGLTTPDALVLHRHLKDLAEAGVDHVALEASSHGLSQCRLDGVHLKAAGFTNLTRDHLDYHATEADYFAAKARLFTSVLADDGIAVVQVADRHGADLAEQLEAGGKRVMRIGHGTGDIALVTRRAEPDGQHLVIRHGDQTHDLHLPLAGAFQADNALMAAGLVIATGGDAEAVFQTLTALKGVPGRMEFAGTSAEGGAVYIDYAHTPDGLRNVLSAAREHTTGSLAVVFGCGGDRDSGKRPVMGTVAGDLADRVYVTDDNPRSEQPALIRADILGAIPGAVEIGDRALAIQTAIQELNSGDLLIIAGKGHEEGQIIKDKVLPFSDREEVARVLAMPEGGKQ